MTMIQNGSPSALALKTPQNLHFGRALKPREKVEWMKAAQWAMGKEGLDKELTIIFPDPCMSSRKGQNTGVGSRLQAGCLDLMDFLKQYFNASSIQFCPDGEHIKEYDAGGKLIPEQTKASLYSSRTFMKTTLMADLLALTTPEWGQLLSKSSYKKCLLSDKQVESQSLVKGPDRARYVQHAFPVYDMAFREAFRKFELKKQQGNPTLLKLDKEFHAYQRKNKGWLEKEGFYNQLKIEHANDPEVVRNNRNTFAFWQDGIDKDLFGALQSTVPAIRKQAEARKQALNNNHNVKLFKFSQFVVSRMIDHRNKEAAEKGIQFIADKKVSIVDADVWGNQDAFTTSKWRLGSPPDYFAEDGQDWGFYILDPDKLFLRDQHGHIQMKNNKPAYGPAGKFLFTVYDKMFQENPGGVRIDHAIGLVDPWVYPASGKPSSPEAGRLFSSPENPELARYSKIAPEDLNPHSQAKFQEDHVQEASLSDEKVKKYAEVIERIILPAAKKNRVSKKNIIFEDLGVVTNPVKKVMEYLGVGGIRVTEFDSHDLPDKDNLNRGKNIPKNYMAALGTHDNNTLIGWTEDEVFTQPHIKDSLAAHLTEDLKPARPESFKRRISQDPMEFAKAKAAELFTVPAKRVEIFWSDLFGIRERFNSPSQRTGERWTLRMPGTSEDTSKAYQLQLQRGKGLNFPEILKMALVAKLNKSPFHSQPPKLARVIRQLDKYARILKEPEPGMIKSTATGLSRKGK